METQQNVKNLQELTGQESGIVIYGNKEAIVCNWTSISGLPKVFITGLLGNDDDIPCVNGEEYKEEQIKNLLEGVTIIYANEEEMPLKAIVYKLNDTITVVAPHGWN